MMTPELRAKKTRRISETIKVEYTKENSELLKALLADAKTEMRGCGLSFTKLTNWLLSQRSPTLSVDEKVSLRMTFHSEKAFAKWMVEEIERAESDGRVVPTIQELLSQKPEAISSIKKLIKAKKVLKSKIDPAKPLLDESTLAFEAPSSPSKNNLTLGQI
jgi:hypothetical protein